MIPLRLAAASLAVLALTGGTGTSASGPPPLVAQPAGVQQAQRPPQQPPSSGQPAPAVQPPVFRAGVELVRLDVRVVDGNGLPIKDLKPEEVQITEGGVQRPIVFFQHVAEPSGTYLEAARRTIGAEVSTNQGAPRGHLYLIVFDQNHITLGNEQRARRAVEKFLKTRVKAGDRVALYALPGPGPQVPLTSNVNIALNELPKVRGMMDRQGLAVDAMMSVFEANQIVRGDPNYLQRYLNRAASNLAAGGDITGVGATPAASATDTANETVIVAKENARTIAERAESESHAFLLYFADVVRELAKIEGRKNVILVSEGFFVDRLRTDIEKVAAAAAEAYAVIYSLDLNVRNLDLNATEPIGATQAAEIQSRLDSLQTLSHETSGEVLLDANARMDEAINQIASSSQDYYVVGFEPPASALGDRRDYRRVAVKVTRRGASVASRTGYAMRDPLTPADRRNSIDAALGAPFPQQGLPLEMTTYVTRGAAPGAQRVLLSLQADLPVAASGGTRPADVVFVARDARDGRVRASGSDVMPLPKTAVPGRTTAKGQFRVQFDLPAGEYLLRAAVREPGGTTGTVDRRFEVRALDGVDVTASDLIIGRQSDALPVRPVCYSSEGLSAALQVYARNPVDLESVEVTLDIVPMDSDAAVRSVKADMGDIRRAGGGAERASQAAVPLDGVPAGDYVARATLRSRGETITEVMRQFAVSAAAPPAAPAVVQERVTPGLILSGELAKKFVGSLGAATPERSPIRLAAAQAGNGAWSEVGRLLGQAAGTQPFGYHALKGLSLFAAERYDEAATALERALVLEPNSAPAAFFLGWVHSSAGHLPEAVTAWRNAVLSDPQMISAYLALAEAYSREHHPELARQVLADGVRLNPASVELKAKLAQVERK
jgi:VWFA-related protein